MAGSDWSLLGVAFTVVGALIVAYGQRVSSREAKSRSDQLIEKSNELAARSDEIAKLNREIADLSQKYAAYVLGTGSYFYLHVTGFGGTPRVEIRHVGANPVRDTEVLVFDITHQISDLASRRVTKYDVEREPRRKHSIKALYAGRPYVLNTSAFEANPTGDTYAYFVNMQGANGTYRQVIQLKRVGDVWKQAYTVQRVLVDDTFEPIGQFFDEDFPTDGELIVRPLEGYPRLR